jgi:hypothetical protein
MYIKDKKMLVFNFIFDLLWTAGGSSVNSVAVTGFIEIKYIANCGFNGKISERAIFELADRMIPAALVTETPGLFRFFHKYSNIPTVESPALITS